MIGRLQGKLISKQAPFILIDVNGVGYEVAVSMNTLYKLGELEDTVTLLTHFVVREDAQLLYGFADDKERKLFRTLIKVNGVGPKLALAILSNVDPEQFVLCVEHHDTASLVKLPGVGKKTAERLVVEMRDRLADWAPAMPSGGAVAIDNKSPVNSVMQEAISALIALGYKPQEASKAISRVDSNESSTPMDSQTLIRLALKQMA